MEKKSKADVVIGGGGIAGIVAAMELLSLGKKVILIDRDEDSNFGGLAKESFGGIFVVGSPQQKRAGIKDSVERAKTDWFATAEFKPEDIYQKKWANYFIEHNRELVYEYLKKNKVSFFPVVHWVERGLYQPGNSCPRFHMVWGTGYGLIETLLNQLYQHPKSENLTLLFRHKVENLIFTNGKVTGLHVTDELNQKSFDVYADASVIATGGMCGGDLSFLKNNWYKEWGNPPEHLLNGSHKYASGDAIKLARQAGGISANLDLQWSYAAGVHHPRPKRDNHGLSLVPPKSAIWMNYKGQRILDPPLVTAFDTRYLVERICKEEKKYSWQVLNYRIALKELAVSGAEYNDAIRDKKLLSFIKTVIFGNKSMVNDLMQNCKDFVVADTVKELGEKMNALAGTDDIDVEAFQKEVEIFDERISDKKYRNDDQFRRLAQLRSYRGDRLRTCKFQKIADPKAGPLIAIREFIVSRKSLGGVVTNLKSQVLNQNHEVVEGLYAIGEAAGYGGGGIHGKRALEGTFLAACVVNAQAAAKAIKEEN